MEKTWGEPSSWSSADIVRQAPFSVFVLDPRLVRTARVVEWGRIEGRLDEVKVEHRARIGRRTTGVWVTTERKDAIALPLQVAAMFAMRTRLDSWLDSEDPTWKGRGWEARRLLLADRRRRAGPMIERAENATFRDLEIPIGATTVHAITARDEQYGLWTAVARIDELTVTIDGDELDVDHVCLVAIDDPGRHFTR